MFPMTIFLIIALFSVLILGHELGHFLTARKIGAKVEEFGFGLPPRVFGVWKEDGKWHYKWGSDSEPQEDKNKTSQKKRENTIYSINLLPIGGFVKIYGEDGGKRNDPDSFAAQSVGKRAIMLAGGVVMNLILAVVFLSVVSFVGSPQSIQGDSDGTLPGARVSDEQVQILAVTEGSPASQAGVKAGDAILELRKDENQVQIGEVSEVQDFTKKYAGEKITLMLKRGDETAEKTLIPREDPPEGQGAMGVALDKTAIVRYPWYLAPVQGVIAAGRMTWMMLGMLGYILKTLIFQGEMMGEIAGPVGIVNLSRQAVQLGFNYFLNFGAIISINLAIINILPFPALDGGRLLFLIIEKFKGSSVSQKTEEKFHRAGFVLLLLLLAVLTFRDVQRLL